MMTTDSERREVARRLRGDPCDTLIPYRTGVHFGMGCHEAANRFWDICERIKAAGDYDIAYSTRSVIADLIEPGCDRDTPQKVAEEMFGKMRHSTKEEADAYGAMLKSKSVEIYPVDRDALLALADDLDRMGDGSMYDPCISDEYGIARRIREILGVKS